MPRPTSEILKAASDTKVTLLAGAIAGIIRDGRQCEVQAIGAGAVNQAVKSIAVARGYTAPSGHDLVCRPSFVTVELAEERTAIRLLIEAV